MIKPVVQVRHLFCALNAKDEYIATLHVERKHGVLWITSVWVDGEYRKKGLGTEMLRQAVSMFGHEPMYLQIAPYADRPLDDSQLSKWYERFGFRSTSIPSILIREGTGS